MNLSTQSSPIRDIPHEKPVDCWEANERVMEQDRHRATIRRSACQEFLAQHGGDTHAGLLIATWFVAYAAGFRDMPGGSPIARSDRKWTARVIDDLLVEILNSGAPLFVVMKLAGGR
jgi:hypothetical protein